MLLMTVVFLISAAHCIMPKYEKRQLIIFNNSKKLTEKIIYTVNHKKLGHFYFYCNFGKCWSIFKILSLSESERNGS